MVTNSNIRQSSAIALYQLYVAHLQLHVYTMRQSNRLIPVCLITLPDGQSNILKSASNCK